MVVCEAYWSLKMIYGLLKIKICIKTIKNTPHFGPEINKNSGTNQAPRLGKRFKFNASNKDSITIPVKMPKGSFWRVLFVFDILYFFPNFNYFDQML